MLMGSSTALMPHNHLLRDVPTTMGPLTLKEPLTNLIITRDPLTVPAPLP